MLIEARVAVYADRLNTVEGQVHATRCAAEVIAALPTASWPAHLTRVVARTGIAPDIALSEVFDAARARMKGDQRPRTRLPVPIDAEAESREYHAGSSVAEAGPAMLADSVQAAQRAAVVRRPDNLPAHSRPRQRL